MTTNLIPMSADEFRARLVDEFGEPFTVSYFDRSTFIDGPSPVLHPWSLVAIPRARGRAPGRADLQPPQTQAEGRVMASKLFPDVELPYIGGKTAPGSALTPQMLRLLGRPVPEEPPPEEPPPEDPPSGEFA
jgi:hypothetical protein